MEVQVSTKLAKQLQQKIRPDGTIRELREDIKAVQDEVNLLLLEEQSEENMTTRSELNTLVALLENKLSQKMSTVPKNDEHFYFGESSWNPLTQRFEAYKTSNLAASKPNKMPISRPKADAKPRPKKKRGKSYYSLLRTKLNVEERNIRQLTDQARIDLAIPGLPQSNVESIVKHIKAQTAENRVATLYLIDSIAKNVGKKYIKLLEPHVQPILSSTYKHATTKKVKDTIVKILKEWHRRKLFSKEARKSIYDDLKRLSGKGGRNQPYTYQQQHSQINPHRLLDRLHRDCANRPDLRPLLMQTQRKLRSGLEITQDIFEIERLLAQPPNSYNPNSPWRTRSTRKRSKRFQTQQPHLYKNS